MSYCATIGFFDGVHRGHQYLISCLRAESERRGLQSAILTFEQHPETVLRGSVKPLLSTFDERTALLKEQGVTEIFCFNFAVIQMMTAEEFMTVLVNNCGVRVLLMGYDHHFGSDHLSDMASYQAAAQRVGLQIVPIPQAPEGDVSSSKIRRALQRGAIMAVNAMLGRPYSFSGVVVHGRGIGRTIGFPTANIMVPEEKLLPMNGVYAVEVIGAASAPRCAILNIGTNPTVGGNTLTTELYIPDFDGDLYDRTLEVRILSFLREEKSFASIAELQQQIAEDVKSLMISNNG